MCAGGWLDELFSENQFALTGQAQTILVTTVLDDDFARLPEQFCAGDPGEGFAVPFRRGYKSFTGRYCWRILLRHTDDSRSSQGKRHATGIGRPHSAQALPGTGSATPARGSYAQVVAQILHGLRPSRAA